MTRKRTFRTTIRNHTNVPEDLIREMIEFSKPSGLPGIEFEIKNTRPGCWRAWAYSAGTGRYDYRKSNGRTPRDPRKPFISIYVPRDVSEQDRPKMVNGYDNRADAARARRGELRYLTGDFWSDHENLLHLIAHEIRHIWQRKVKRGRRVWGSRGQMSERDADAYAIQIVRRWRRR